MLDGRMICKDGQAHNARCQQRRSAYQGVESLRFKAIYENVNVHGPCPANVDCVADDRASSSDYDCLKSAIFDYITPEHRSSSIQCQSEIMIGSDLFTQDEPLTPNQC